MSDRKEGFYWIKLYNEWMVGKWNIEYQHWDIPDYIPSYEDRELQEIDERPIVREEPEKRMI